MLHTIIPPEVIYKTSGETKLQYEEIQYKGQLVEARIEHGQYILNRVLTTDLQVFLDASFAPGTTLETRSVLCKGK